MKQKGFNWRSATARSISEVTGLAPVEGIIQIASELTEDCGLTHPGTNLDFLASFQGAKIEECQMNDTGRLITLNSPDCQYLIQVNADDPRSRKNFSICHEIGHTLMPNFDGSSDPPPDFQIPQWDQNNEEEFLCDVAAGELLMPRSIFIPRLRGCGLYIQSLEELANEFCASIEATAISIVNANVGDIAVIVWELGLNKAQVQDTINPMLPFDDSDCISLPERAFRIKFSSGCGEMKDFFFPTNISTESDSLIAQAADKATPICGMQELRLGGNIRRSFYTQSQAFTVRRGNTYEPKVITMVQKHPPDLN